MTALVRHILAVLLVAVPGTAALAQGIPSWLETRHDFGVIREQDGQVSCIMRVVNTGDSALHLLRVRTSCGCTAVDFTRTPITPGDTGQVKVTYSPKNRPGEFDKDVWVYTNGQPSRTRLQITGNTIPAPATLDEQYPVAVGDLRLSGALVTVGEVLRGKGRNAYLNGYNASTDTLLVTVAHAPAHIRARAVPDTVPPGATTALTIFVDSNLAPLWGLNTDSLDVMAEPMSQHAEALSGITRIEVMANVRENFERLDERDLERAPKAVVGCGERLNFAPTTCGQRATQTFDIANTGHDPLVVRRLWSGDNTVTATADKTTIKRGKHATVTVTVDTRPVQGPVFNTLLEVTTNDPANPRQIVRLVGEVNQE